MLNRSASLAMSTSVLKALPGKLAIKRHSPSILYLFDSLTKFVEDADDDCVRIVDSLLDVLTKGQHTLTKKQLEMVSLT